MLTFVVSRLICRRPLYGTLARRFLLETEIETGLGAIPRPAPLEDP